MEFGLNPFLLFPIFLLASIIGVFSIIAGFGGGVFLVPLLTVLFEMPMKIIIGTVMLTLVFPAFIGSIGAWRRGEIDIRLAVMFEIPTVIGSVVGATITAFIPEGLLKISFGLLAAFFSFNMINKARKDKDVLVEDTGKFWGRLISIPPVMKVEREDYSYTISLPVIIAGGLVIGFFAGMFGVGGGWLKTPLLVLVFGVPALIASGTAIFMILITTISGGLTHLIHGNLDPYLFITLSLALPLGAAIGNYLKPKLNNEQITEIVGISLLLVAIMMIISAVIT